MVVVTSGRRPGSCGHPTVEPECFLHGVLDSNPPFVVLRAQARSGLRWYRGAVRNARLLLSGRDETSFS